MDFETSKETNRIKRLKNLIKAQYNLNKILHKRL